MHLYHAFGITIGSQILLPELVPARGCAPDVLVQTGTVKPLVFETGEDRVWFKGGEGWLQFEVEGVARFLVQGGNGIVIDAELSASECDVRLFLLGSGLGALLMQRGLLVFHGSTVAERGRAITFLGDSGAGKSTLATALRQRGLLLVGDDLCVVSTDGAILVYPAYPQNKLWEDSLKYLDVEAAGLARVRRGVDKRALPVEVGSFCEGACHLGRIFALARSEAEGVKVGRLSGASKMASLLAFRYRPQFVKVMGLERRQFEQLGRIAREVPLGLIARPEGRLVVDELVARVLSDSEDEA